MKTASKVYTLIIEQLDIDRTAPLFNGDTQKPQCWPLMMHVFLGLEPVEEWTARVTEPLTNKERSEIAFYLNDILNSLSWPTQRAKNARELIRKYRKNLFAAIKVQQNWNFPNEKFGLKLEVLCNKKFLNLGGNVDNHTRSIHSFHWELLEKLDVWMVESLSSVVVRRRLDRTDRIPGEETRNIVLSPVFSFSDSTPYSSTQTFNILLVIARRVTRNTRTELCDPYGPTAIPAAVLEIQQYLKSIGSKTQLALRVVRPGSLEILTKILKHSTVTYNIVHFDMHGHISKNRATMCFGSKIRQLNGIVLTLSNRKDTNRVELQFNISDDDQLTEKWVDGECIAENMRKHQIECVIIGACFSASANASANANLALLMIEKKDYFNKFYKMLFVQRNELSEAAQLARTALRDQAWRYYYQDSSGWKKIEDWFVPVLYSSGASFIAQNRSWDLYGKRSLLLTTRWCTLSASCIFTLSRLPATLTSWRWWPSMASISFVFFLLLCASHLPTSWLARQWHQVLSTGPESLETALKESVKDKTNILRLENELDRIRKVYFYTPFDGQKSTPQRLLEHMLPIWERTGLVDGCIRLDYTDFQKSPLPSFWLYAWYISCHRLWAARKSSNPQLIIVVDNVHELYMDSGDQELVEARLLFEEWVRKIFPLDKGLKAGVALENGSSPSAWWQKWAVDPTVSNPRPYLILTAKNQAKSPDIIRNLLTANFDKVPSLQNIGITEFEMTDSLAISTERV